MDKAQLIKLAIAGGIVYATYRYSKSPAVKAAALGVAGVLVVKNIPFINQYVPV